MRCNERSPVTLEEANMYNNGMYEYPCFEEVHQLFDYCGPDLFEMLVELYRQRVFGATDKNPNYSKINNFQDVMNPYNDRKVLHY